MRSSSLKRAASVAASSPAKIVGEGEAVDKVGIGVCLGRAGSRYAKMDGWEVMEREQSFGELSHIPGDGGQAWRWSICPTTC